MSKRLRGFMCNNNPDNFCNICGKFMKISQALKFSEALQQSYFNYFGISPTINEPWAPKMLCALCSSNLTQWAAGKCRYMKFDTPMIWRQPLCHSIDCYFCLSKRSGFGKNLKWEYALVDSAVFPVAHSNDIPYQICPGLKLKNVESSEASIGSGNSDFEPALKQQILSQAELNDWVRDLGLSKDKAERFASRMKERGFAAPHTTNYSPKKNLFT